jgi:hypothetical protein
MCIIYFGTVDNTFFFYIGSSDWHHEVFLLPTERRISGPLGFIVPVGVPICFPFIEASML